MMPRSILSLSLLLHLLLLLRNGHVVVAQGEDNQNNANQNNAAAAVQYDFKDVNYYPNGMSPYASNPMYYSEATGVLADLQKFDALYIHYHSCV
jgi:hypothetical protein